MGRFLFSLDIYFSRHSISYSSILVIDTNFYPESSGIFTFPETGIYKIEYHLAAYRSSGAFVRYAQGDIEITTDNSSYNNAARAYSSISNDATAYMSVTVSAIFDVTNTSTHKCKFDYAAESSLTWEGSSTMNRTHVTFIRLGDT